MDYQPGEDERGAKEGWSEATARAIFNILSSRFDCNLLACRFAPRPLLSSQSLQQRSSDWIAVEMRRDRVTSGYIDSCLNFHGDGNEINNVAFVGDDAGGFLKGVEGR